MIQKLTSVAKSLPAEDICTGDYVALLSITCQYPSFMWAPDVHLMPVDVPVTIEWLFCSEDQPLVVKSVCLPFVFVQSPKGDYETIDVRRSRLCRIDRAHGELVWNAFKCKRKKCNENTGKSRKKRKKKNRK